MDERRLTYHPYIIYFVHYYFRDRSSSNLRLSLFFAHSYRYTTLLIILPPCIIYDNIVEHSPELPVPL